MIPNKLPTFDYTFLEQPITQKQYRSAFKESGFGAWAYFYAAFGIFTAVIFLSVGSPPTALAFIGIAAGLYWLVMKFYGRPRARESIILKRFMKTNSLTSINHNIASKLAGSMFHIKTFHANGSIEDGFGAEDEDWLIFNYHVFANNGSRSSEYEFGVLRFKLGREVPNIIIKEAHNESMTHTFTRSYLGDLQDESQRLQLEGNFNDYFKVYTPHEYQTDALYILTPELMAELIDNAQHMTIELIDNDLFIYAQRFNFSAKHLQQTMEHLDKIVSIVCDEFVDNTKNYRDDHLETLTPPAEEAANDNTIPVPSIARQGRRLKERRPGLWS